jgi:hypothetical protein
MIMKTLQDVIKAFGPRPRTLDNGLAQYEAYVAKTFNDEKSNPDDKKVAAIANYLRQKGETSRPFN